MAPCDWPIDTTCCAGWDDFPPEVQARATTMATEILDGLTGRQFAQCPMSFRPCGPKCSAGAGYMVWPVSMGAVGGGYFPWMVPWVDAGVWRNCACPGACSCAATQEVPIPFPVASIEEVTIDGVVLAPTAYRLDSWRGIPRLVRTDGGAWPTCQDMDADPDAVGSFTITFRPGRPLPLAGQIAAGDYACELAKACMGQDCALPQQLASLTRNGIDLEVVDPTTAVEDGRTGIQSVDLWVRSVNPGMLSQRTRVHSPDVNRGRLS